jgi:hypothetical protein
MCLPSTYLSMGIHVTIFTGFRLSSSLVIDVNSVLGLLHRVVMDDNADVSESACTFETSSLKCHFNHEDGGSMCH